ncbi:MFS transporter [Paraburkholderia humisilvae]|uniref:Multidrug resistance protein 3 n=1 Tax=Paraburkholderia humisilvae TaxID=627669 RepID=A0A6J5D2A2_9BURK|nr:MFS transporter [Paraburkholderia humisilvae]CAB3746826.1 Multidrug resistance protein 3 [Paraburkholderia humisilvae]
MKEAILESTATSLKDSRLAVASVIAALFLAAVDSTIVSTALPSIAAQLGTPELYPWIMSGFLLPVALVAPLAGACADRLGVSAVLKLCLIVFLAASACAALSPSMPLLIAARVLQGASAGGIIVLAYSMLANLFDAERRGRMQGMLSTVWGLSAVAGPLLGSALDVAFGWRAIFWFNLPVGVAALSMLCIAPGVGKPAGNARVDLPAQALMIILLCSVLLLVSQPGDTTQVQYGLFGAAAAASALLVARIAPDRQRSPLPLAFFQRRALLSATGIVLLSSGGLFASVTLAPLVLKPMAGASLSTGVIVMMAALGWVAGAALCGARLARAGYRTMAGAGMLLLAAGCFTMPFALEHQLVPLAAAALALVGLGMGFAATTTLVFAQNSAPVGRLASWTSTVQCLRNLGAALGVNALGTIQLRLSGDASFQTCFTILGSAMLAGLIVSLFLPAQYQVDHD